MHHEALVCHTGELLADFADLGQTLHLIFGCIVNEDVTEHAPIEASHYHNLILSDWTENARRSCPQAGLLWLKHPPTNLLFACCKQFVTFKHLYCVKGIAKQRASENEHFTSQSATAQMTPSLVKIGGI